MPPPCQSCLMNGPIFDHECAADSLQQNLNDKHADESAFYHNI